MSNTHMSHLGIRGRLISGFAAVISFFVISVIVSVYFIHATQNDAQKFLNMTMPAGHAIIDLQGELIDVEMLLPSLVIFHDTRARQDIDREFAIIEEMRSKINPMIDSMNNTSASQRWSATMDGVDIFIAKINDLYKLIDAGSAEKALEYYRSDVLPYIFQMNDMFNVDVTHQKTRTGVVDALSKEMISSMTQINDQVSIMQMTAFIFLIISIIVSYVIASITSKSILSPVQYANEIAKKIAAGDRNVVINIHRNDETGQLLESLASMRDSINANEKIIMKSSEDNKRLYDSVVKSAKLFSQHASRVSAGELTGRLELEKGGIDQEIMLRLGQDLNNMTENLNNVTHDIVRACSSMVSTLEEVRHAVDAQSSGASEQASSINQITASISEIEKSATQTMSKARDLGGVAEKTRKSGQLGLESIETSVQGMKSVKDKVQLIAQTILDLSRQTQQVGEITSVVNNLAQQSKMLALNASIEAAKAGDAGKGFAVVAAEVKNLAEQSEQSTSQVQKILEDIKIATEKAVMVTEEGTKGVDNGLQMIERTGEIIRNLNEVIREAAIASQQIESAVRQESAGIEQITAGMNEINMVTSAFVESANQTTDAMENLSNVTRKLKSSVETYKI